jgi:hypothetical protein
MSLGRTRAVVGCFCAAVLAAVGHADLVFASFPRSGNLQVTKECSSYTGAAGDVCTITPSNVTEIAPGSTIVYAQAADFSTLSLDSDIVLDLPGPGINTVIGHCQLSLLTGIGLCTFSGGTGKFTHFQGSASVSPLGGPNYAWDGTYTFDPRD